MVQYWLQRHQGDRGRARPRALSRPTPVYARHIGQLNVLTYLIEHRDSNVGNFLIGKSAAGARVFSIDHGVAFASKDSDRGELWKDMRVNRLPADTVARLRKVTREDLEARLGVLAQWQLQTGHLRSGRRTARTCRPIRGVRRSGDDLQMGLTKSEIGDVYRLLQQLLEQGRSRRDHHRSDGELTMHMPRDCARSAATACPAGSHCSASLAVSSPCAGRRSGPRKSQWTGVETRRRFRRRARRLHRTGRPAAGSRHRRQGPHWAAGRAHVVSLGDLLDRGADSRKVMDLLMRLQGEAAAAGGQLHVVLGNHEAMNLLGDLRYVVPASTPRSPATNRRRARGASQGLDRGERPGAGRGVRPEVSARLLRRIAPPSRRRASTASGC